MSHVSIDKQKEIDANLSVFIASKDDIADRFPGKHVLMRHGVVIAAYATALDAQIAGDEQFADGIFSIQEAAGEAGDLGFYSHVLCLWRS